MTTGIRNGQPGDDGNPANELFIFNNHVSPVGNTLNLGSLAVGTELEFRLFVTNTGNNFYTGPATRNSDNHTHARVQADWLPGTTLVSFEDLLNGPFEYNDLSFSFTNTSSTPGGPAAAPEPMSLVLLGTGLAGLMIRRCRKDDTIAHSPVRATANYGTTPRRRPLWPAAKSLSLGLPR